jgi:hypothetical protein
MGEAAETAARSRSRWLVWPFAALGVATAIAIVWLAVELSGPFGGREPAIVAAGHATDDLLMVGNVTPLAGTNLIAIEIRAVEGDRGKVSSGSYYGNDTRNLLFLDRATGISRRVMPDNAAHISDIDYLPAAAEANSQSAIKVGAEDSFRDGPPAYYLLTLERRSKNGDKTYDLLVGTIATGKQAVIMRGLAGMDQSGMLDASRLGVIVREGQSLFYRVIDIPALKQVESHKIEIG